MTRWLRQSSSGFSFIELVVATAIMMVLASAAMPLARVSIKRQKEAELHRSLREMRSAIDAYHDAVTSNIIGGISVSTTSEGYPPDLETLVNGVVRANDPSGRKIKFLRRIPIDPMTGSAEWGLLAYADKPDSTAWGGANVYNIYSKSPDKGLDGTKYKDW
jgi:general secretion pathway protein G